MSTLAVEGLRVRLPTPAGQVTVVDGVDYEVQPAEVFGIAGESGSGKTVSMLALLGLLPEGVAGVGQCDGQRALVARIAIAADEASGLQPLDQRGEGPRVELEEDAEPLDRQRPVLPEGQHDQVLRMGQPHRLEERPVDGDDVPRGHGQRVTDLLLKVEGIARLDSGHTMSVPIIGVPIV